MLDERITNTPIGREYMWDRVSDADPELLRQNRASMMRVLQNPDQFPNADFAKCEALVAAIDEFFGTYPDLLEQFA